MKKTAIVTFLVGCILSLNFMPSYALGNSDVVGSSIKDVSFKVNEKNELHPQAATPVVGVVVFVVIWTCPAWAATGAPKEKLKQVPSFSQRHNGFDTAIKIDLNNLD